MRSDEKTAADVTADVGSEGGTTGDVEVGRSERPAVGSEAGETQQPADGEEEPVTIVRDETGEGRRSP